MVAVASEVDPKPWMAEAFGRAAPSYDRVLPFCSEFAEDLLADAAPLPGEDALDVACGRGAVTLPLARAVAPGSVVAVDLSEGMIRELRAELEEQGVSNVDSRVADAERLDLEPLSIDLVTCGFGMQYLYEPERLCSSVERGLRSGGRFAASIPVQMEAPWDVYGDLVRRFASRLVEAVVPGPPRPHLVSLLTASGLQVHSERTVRRSFTLASTDDWWHWTLSHGHRVFLDGLTSDDREEFRSEASRLMEPHRADDGYEMTWTTQVVVASKT